MAEFKDDTITIVVSRHEMLDILQNMGAGFTLNVQGSDIYLGNCNDILSVYFRDNDFAEITLSVR